MAEGVSDHIPLMRLWEVVRSMRRLFSDEETDHLYDCER
jgi:hypothetical protein